MSDISVKESTVVASVYKGHSEECNDHSLGKVSALKDKIPEPREPTKLEVNAEQMVGSDKVSMIFADPKSEFFLALAARVVTAVVKGTNIRSNLQMDASLEDISPSELSVEELLALREKKI